MGKSIVSRQTRGNFIIFFWFWAHPRAAGARTGLSACIFFASGKKGYRFNPLRVPCRAFSANIGPLCGFPETKPFLGNARITANRPY
jgi:hypothetical protein